MSEQTDPEMARDYAKDIKPATWKEGDKTFFYPSLDNHMRFHLHDLLLRMADTQERLEQENKTLMSELADMVLKAKG